LRTTTKSKTDCKQFGRPISGPPVFLFHLECKLLINRFSVLGKPFGDGLEAAAVAGGVDFYTIVGTGIDPEEGMPVKELAEILALAGRDGAVVGDGIGDSLEVHDAYVGGEV
jgi:hypothetical protein